MLMEGVFVSHVGDGTFSKHTSCCQEELLSVLGSGTALHPWSQAWSPGPPPFLLSECLSVQVRRMLGRKCQCLHQAGRTATISIHPCL